MKTTKHRVKKGPGRSFEASVDHEYGKAVQFDFYIPTKIWKVPLVRGFFDVLSKLGGATLFEEETGMWKGAKEKTHVFRIIIRPGDVNLQKVRETLRKAIGELMAALSASQQTAQQMMMYTETLTTMVMAKNVTRIK